MSGLQPVGMYSMRVPPGDFMLPAVPEHAAMFRVTMAAIDPTEEPDFQDVEDKTERATLKIVRVPDELLEDDSDSEDHEDYMDMDDDEIESDEEEGINGGPSDQKKSKLSTKQALIEALAADEEEDEDDEEDEAEIEDDEKAGAEAIEKLKAAMKEAKSKGKGKAVDDEDEDEEDDESIDSDAALGFDETVICTLDTKNHYQQPLDMVIAAGERIFFKVSGTHTVHLTGNFVIPEDDGSASLYDEEEDEEDEDDISLDEDDPLGILGGGDSESDELDDIQDPRVTEVDSDDETQPPKLIQSKKEVTKGKNKRPAAEDEDDSDEPALDDIMSKALKKEDIAAAAAAAGAPTTNGEAPKKLSKAEKRRLKKLKNNDGEAAAAPTTTETTVKKETLTNGTNGTEKKVQFAKNLEQGPTPSGNVKSSQTAVASSSPAPASSPGTASSDSKKPSGNIKTVQGVTIDDRRMGSGPAAKKGSRLELRYIGKLQATSRIFDSNKSGKPFNVKLGAGEVIQGWDVGLQGIQPGGERRIVIPANMAYGNKDIPKIPKNSTLIFDIKCLSVK